MRRSFLIILGPLGVLLLAACTPVDTTGISAETSRGPYPTSNPASLVLVQEYSDLQCPACRQAEYEIVQPLLEELSSEIRYEYMQFPLLTTHPYALPAAEASECAADQGRFWDYVAIAFEKQPEMNRTTLREWAEELGLDMEFYDRCTRSRIKQKTILAEFEAGRKRGVGGTPTFYVNGTKVENDLDALRAAIQQALGKGGTATGSRIRL